MPATPFHLPPAALLAWPVRRRLDVPCVLLVNVTVDIEPGVAMLFGSAGPPHGPVHTLLGATLVGVVTGWLVWRGRGWLGRLVRRAYAVRRGTAILSAVLGGWLHVLLDAIMYDHLRPFFPLDTNPLYVAGSGPVLHALGAAALVPVAVLVVRARAWRTAEQRLTIALLALSAVWMPLRLAVGGV